ncbi:MAG: hypothetical protein HZA93_05160 [Verrucomicrobia bacterium]|nr:hypothetical protein [Verrucomicrobiota bacterium]
MTAPSRVFLVPSGYNFRAVLAFCRALRLARLPIAIVACTRDDPIFRTRYARNVVYLRPGHKLDVVQFAAATALARSHTGAARCVLAPASEYLVRWALQHRTALESAGCDLPLPDAATYFRVTEKASLTSFCRGFGLPVPAEIPEASPATLPCVAKPRWNVAPDGRSLYPWLLRTPADLARFAAEARPQDFFFQEWVEGRSFYLLFHLPAHGAATRYSQENLAQQPGGKSMVLARAADLHRTPEAGRWEAMLRATGFHGLVMLELRQRGSEFVLIEANPRLWGPLQLCVDGCPRLLANYLAEHTGTAPAPLAARPPRDLPHYLWLGGVIPGASLAWHVRPPGSGFLTLLRHCRSDVYLRPDSWRQFLHERRAARQPASARTGAIVPPPQLPAIA